MPIILRCHHESFLEKQRWDMSPTFVDFLAHYILCIMNGVDTTRKQVNGDPLTALKKKGGAVGFHGSISLPPLHYNSVGSLLTAGRNTTSTFIHMLSLTCIESWTVRTSKGPPRPKDATAHLIKCLLLADYDAPSTVIDRAWRSALWWHPVSRHRLPMIDRPISDVIYHIMTDVCYRSTDQLRSFAKLMQLSMTVRLHILPDTMLTFIPHENDVHEYVKSLLYCSMFRLFSAPVTVANGSLLFCAYMWL